MGRMRPMTICIASICQNKYAIIASDRMITVSLPNIEFERRVAKILELSKSCVVVTAGSALAHTELFRNTKTEIEKEQIKPISGIVEITKESYRKEREKKIEEEITKPIGLSLEDYYARQRAMAPELTGGIFQKIAEYDYYLWLIIAGVDDSGAHIYSIENPGTSECFDAIGYHAIGSGEYHAISTFISNEYEEDISLKKGLLLTYEAKKRSEKAQGVGEMTDLLLVSKKGIKPIPDETISELNKIYEKKLEMDKKSNRELEPYIKKLKLKMDII